ncbi:MAG: LacI family DNA-binding transcriptional regulator [Thermodesulfobacteriota bacterium]
MRRYATIKDIAKLVGVSHTTVHRALNDKPRISQSTKDRIISIARELNYQPNVLAQSLVLGRTKTLGLVITTIVNPLYPELAKGIEDAARFLGYNIILCCTNFDISLEKQYIDMLRSRGVDGIIFTSAHIHDPNITRLVKDQFPLILVNRRVYGDPLMDRIDYVVAENAKGGFLAVEHLIKMGHKMIGVISGPPDSSAAVERLEGARKAFIEYGLNPAELLVLEGDFLKPSGYEAARKFLSLRDAPSAIFSVNDYMALGALEGILDSGFRIPEDIALVGFNDIEFTSLKAIELTTIGQKKYEMGSIAVHTLIDKIEGRDGDKVRQITLEPELIVRRSCGYQLRGYTVPHPEALLEQEI